MQAASQMRSKIDMFMQAFAPETQGSEASQEAEGTGEQREVAEAAGAAGGAGGEKQEGLATKERQEELSSRPHGSAERRRGGRSSASEDLALTSPGTQALYKWEEEHGVKDVKADQFEEEEVAVAAQAKAAQVAREREREKSKLASVSDSRFLAQFKPATVDAGEDYPCGWPGPPCSDPGGALCLCECVCVCVCSDHLSSSCTSSRCLAVRHGQDTHSKP